jgi:hypothetical protein
MHAVVLNQKGNGGPPFKSKVENLFQHQIKQNPIGMFSRNGQLLLHELMTTMMACPISSTSACEEEVTLSSGEHIAYHLKPCSMYKWTKLFTVTCTMGGHR